MRVCLSFCSALCPSVTDFVLVPPTSPPSLHFEATSVSLLYYHLTSLLLLLTTSNCRSIIYSSIFHHRSQSPFPSGPQLAPFFIPPPSNLVLCLSPFINRLLLRLSLRPPPLSALTPFVLSEVALPPLCVFDRQGQCKNRRTVQKPAVREDDAGYGSTARSSAREYLPVASAITNKQSQETKKKSHNRCLMGAE